MNKILYDIFVNPLDNQFDENYKKSSIILNPSAAKSFLDEDEFEINICKEILKLINEFPLNSLLLCRNSIVPKVESNKKDVIDSLIYFFFQKIKEEKSESSEIIDFIVNLLKLNNISRSNLNIIYKINAMMIYNEQISNKIIFNSIKLMQELFLSQNPSNVPTNFFYFPNLNSGIQIVPNKQINWSFSKAMCIGIWFYIEETKEITRKDKIAKLFTIHSNKNGGGGMEAYFIGNNLYYRVLAMNYQNPNAGSNGLLIGEYQVKTWYFLGLEHHRLEHENKGTKIYERSHLQIFINEKLYKHYSIEFPKIQNDVEITTMGFGMNFIGRISTIMLFNANIGKTLENLYSYFNYGIQSNSALKNLPKSLEQYVNCFYLLYVPHRSNESTCFDLINNNDGKFLNQTGVISKDLLKNKMSFYGGMSTILPFFYLLRFCNNIEFPGLLNEMLRLIIILLKNKIENQKEALKINFFQILGQHLSEINCNFFNHETLELLAELKNTIKENKLLDQLFTDVIWNMEFLENCHDVQNLNDYFKFIRTFYLEKQAHYSSLFGVSEILMIAVNKFDFKNMLCCEYHCLALGIEKNETINIENKADKIIWPILGIVEMIIINGGENISSEFIQILRAFNSKSSPCFLLQLFKLLKSILIDRVEENQQGLKVMLKILSENSFITTLIYLISTSPCLDIKAMSIKFISYMILQKVQGINENELSQYISSVIWSLNIPKTQPQQKSPDSLNLPKKNDNKNITRKSYQKPIEQEFTFGQESRSSRSKSVETNPTFAYKKEMINEEKLNKKSIMIVEDIKNEDEEKLSENSLSLKNEKNQPIIEEISSSDSSSEVQLEKIPSQKQEIKELNFEKSSPVKEEFNLDTKNLGTQFLNDEYDNIPQAPSMSNKRKPGAFGFGKKEEKKGFDLSLSSNPLESNNQEKEQFPSENIFELNKEKPIIKKKIGPKFDLSLKEEFLPENDKKEDLKEKEILTDNLTETVKIKKSKINFPLPEITVTNENNFKIDPSQKKKSNTMISKPFKKPLVSIDTEQINENFSYGGEKGKKVFQLNEFSEEYREITELASLCLKYMKGELNNDDYFANKMPMIKKFDAPQSVRGLKTVSFPDSEKVSKFKSPKDLTVIKETSMSFDTSNELSFSSSLDIQKNSIEETLIQRKTEDSVVQLEKKLPALDQELESMDYEPLYHAIMEWSLRKTPSNLDGQLIIDDTDKIDLNSHVILIITFFKNCAANLKPKIMNDIIMLIKWNTSNCNVFLECEEFLFWILDLLLQQQINVLDNKNSAQSTIFDFAIKIYAILFKHAITSNNNNSFEKFSDSIMFFQSQTLPINGVMNYNQKKVANSAKFLLRHLLTHLFELLLDSSKISRPIVTSSFWKNMIYIALIVEEIVFWTYPNLDSSGKVEFHNELYPTLKNSCNIITDEKEIPINFKKIYSDNKWLDHKIVDYLFKIFDSLWPENFLKESTFDEITQKKLNSMMDYLTSGEYGKDLDIFMMEPYINHENLSRRGTFIKTINYLISLSIDFQFKYEKTNILEQNLDRYTRIIKYLIIVCENSREKQLNNLQREKIISNIVFPLSFLFGLYEKQKTSIDNYSDNIENNDLNIKIYNEKISILKKTIENLLKFIFIIIDFMDNKIGGFKNYPELKKNSFSTLSASAQIPLYNMFLYEISHSLLLNQKNEKIINITSLSNVKNKNFDFFSDDLVFAFSKSNIIKDLLSKKFENENELHKYGQYFTKLFYENKEINKKKKSEIDRQNEQNKIKYENDIYEQTLSILEDYDVKKQNEVFLAEKKFRQTKFLWDKIWKRLRTYQGPWRHENFKAQNDKLFDPNDFKYENQEINKIFYYKIWKYELKNRIRPFLKLKLYEPQIIINNNNELKQKKMALLNNYQHILHLGTTKASQKAPLNETKVEEENIPSSKNIKTNFIGDMTKNITKGIKAFLPISQVNKAFPFLNNYKSEDVYLQKKCQWISILSIRNGVLVIASDQLIFHFESLEQKDSHLAFLSYKLGENRPFFKEWPLESIKEIQRRRFILRKTALEIFLTDGSSILFNFPDSDSEEVSQKLIRLRKTKCIKLQYNTTLDPRKLIDKSGVMKKWLNYEISNFDYLMSLNSLSGRSYKDVTQYPVFPWILANYLCEKLSSNDINLFRDLNKTMGAMGKEDRIKLFMERYEHEDPYNPVPKYHYGSHYSSPAIVFHYLIRLSPFVIGAKELQNGKFDLPDRLFFDLQDSFRCATEEISDVRELIPEFFYLPELCINLDKHEFGVQQSGLHVHNLILPKWANENPYNFIVLHRMMLESEFVSKNIHNWIDLIFGYKQRGKEAEKNLNTFFYMTYEDSVEVDKIEDQHLRISTEAQIVHFGQTPSQLFIKPHPQRNTKETAGLIYLINEPNANLKIYKPSSKIKSIEGKENVKINFKNFENNAIIKMKVIAEGKIFSLKKNGSLTSYKWISPPHSQSNSNIPFSCALEKEKLLNFCQIRGDHPFKNFDFSLDLINYPLQFLNMGKILICGGQWDGRLIMISTETDNIIDFYIQHIDTVTVIESDRKDNFLITGSKNGEVIYWKITAEYKLIAKYFFNDHCDEITSIFISSEMRCFASSDSKGFIFIYNYTNGLLIKSLYHPNGNSIDHIILTTSPLTSVIYFSKDDNYLLSYSINGQLLEKSKEESQITSILLMKWNNGLEFIICGTERGEIIFRDLPFLGIKRKIILSTNNAILSIIATIDRKFLLFGCSNGDLAVMADPNTNKINHQNVAIQKGEKN